jgi:hypothetical protein
LGTDICIYAERRRTDGSWEFIDTYAGYTGDELDADHPYALGRCYDMFGLLGGVRSDVEPLMYPRGVPEDATPEYREHAKHGYQHTWYTLRELWELDWNKTAAMKPVRLDAYGLDIWRRRVGGDVGPRTLLEPPYWTTEYDPSEPEQATKHLRRRKGRVYFKAFQKLCKQHGVKMGVIRVGVADRFIDEDRGLEVEETKLFHEVQHEDIAGVWTTLRWCQRYLHQAGPFYKYTLPALTLLGDIDAIRVMIFWS